MPDGDIGKAIFEKYVNREQWEDSYNLSTGTIRRIGRYSGLNFNEVLELPYSFFVLLNRDSWIDSWMQSESGVDFLKNLWRLQQTKSDNTAIYQFMHRKGGD